MSFFGRWWWVNSFDATTWSPANLWKQQLHQDCTLQFEQKQGPLDAFVLLRPHTERSFLFGQTSEDSDSPHVKTHCKVTLAVVLTAAKEKLLGAPTLQTSCCSSQWMGVCECDADGDMLLWYVQVSRVPSPLRSKSFCTRPIPTALACFSTPWSSCRWWACMANVRAARLLRSRANGVRAPWRNIMTEIRDAGVVGIFLLFGGVQFQHKLAAFATWRKCCLTRSSPWSQANRCC